MIKIKNWTKLVGYGSYSHNKGTQVITRKTGLHLVKQFNGLLKKIGLRKIPVYVGHPDDEEFFGQPGHKDFSICGHLEDIKSDINGISVKIKWTELGKVRVQNGMYKYLSPRWSMNKIKEGYFEPTKLISLGLTNNPNLQSEKIQEDVTCWANSVAGVKLKACSQTEGVRKTRLQKKSIHKFVDLVQNRMKETGEDYSAAWFNVKENYSFLLN